MAVEISTTPKEKHITIGTPPCGKGLSYDLCRVNPFSPKVNRNFIRNILTFGYI